MHYSKQAELKLRNPRWNSNTFAFRTLRLPMYSGLGNCCFRCLGSVEYSGSFSDHYEHLDNTFLGRSVRSARLEKFRGPVKGPTVKHELSQRLVFSEGRKASTDHQVKSFKFYRSTNIINSLYIFYESESTRRRRPGPVGSRAACAKDEKKEN